MRCRIAPPPRNYRKTRKRRIAKMRREFREQFDATVVAHATGADRGDPNAQPSLVKHVSEGDTVKLKSMGRAAVVKKRIGDNHFDVEIGSMKMRIARDDIAEVLTSAARASESPVQAARSRGISVSLQNESGSRNMPSEINVIGRTVDEATSEVEKFVDRAFLAGMPRVRIVHGSGMGVLRKALRQHLKAAPARGIDCGTSIQRRGRWGDNGRVEGVSRSLCVPAIYFSASQWIFAFCSPHAILNCMPSRGNTQFNHRKKLFSD